MNILTRIVFKNTDGSVGVIIPAENTALTIEEIAEKDVPKGLDYRITTTDALPTDRYFRNAWTDDNLTDTVDVDLTKARDIHMIVLRKLRDAKMVKLDIEQLKGKDVLSAKQVLRDLPQTIDLTHASTPSELKALIPQELLNDT